MLPAGGAGGGGLLGGLLGGGAGRELQALADQGGAREAAVRAAGVPYTVVRVSMGWDQCGGLLPCGGNGREGVGPAAYWCTMRPKYANDRMDRSGRGAEQGRGATMGKALQRGRVGSRGVMAPLGACPAHAGHCKQLLLRDAVNPPCASHCLRQCHDGANSLTTL